MVFINKNPYQDTEKIEERAIEILNNFGYDITDDPQKADLALSIGGDGTFLDTIKLAPNANIIGINKGTLGYLAEVEVEDLEKALTSYVNGQYKIQKRMMIDCMTQNIDGVDGSPYYLTALNDIVVTKRNSSVIDVEIIVDNCLVTKYYADGIIVSTPTGSTGYAFSCGCPIIDPTSEMMIITPIAPHSIMNRSICVSPNSGISIKVVNARDDDAFRLDVDGNKHIVELGNSIHITKSSNVTRMVKFAPNTSFLDRIMQKMS